VECKQKLGERDVPKICCPNCNASDKIKKSGFTKKGRQRYMCSCGKSFIAPKGNEGFICPNCNSPEVIKWGEFHWDYLRALRKNQRYLCKRCGKTHSDKIYSKELDEEMIIRAYLTKGLEKGMIDILVTIGKLRNLSLDQDGGHQGIMKGLGDEHVRALFVTYVTVAQQFDSMSSDDKKAYLFLRGINIPLTKDNVEGKQ